MKMSTTKVPSFLHAASVNATRATNKKLKILFIETLPSSFGFHEHHIKKRFQKPCKFPQTTFKFQQLKSCRKKTSASMRMFRKGRVDDLVSRHVTILAVFKIGRASCRERGERAE